jgi:hypothetical protein
VTQVLEKMESGSITVLIDPELGGTICHIGSTSDPESNVLAWYEWDEPKPLSLDFLPGESAKHWLSRYRGGWQFLTPNAGGECVIDGVRHSFHGESSYMPWRVTMRTGRSLTMEIVVMDSLQVTRTLTLDETKPILLVETEITNIIQDPQEVVMVEHAAFQGTPNIEVAAPTNSTWKFDAGYDEGNRKSISWSESGLSGPDLRIPIVGRTERMTYLVDGNEGWASIFDRTKKFGARITWNRKTLPYLWYWQERSSPGFPFYGRAEMTALEPASCLPGDTLLGASRDGRSKTILPGTSFSFSLELEII